MNRHKNESDEREGKGLGRKESGGVGDPSGFTRPSSRTERVSNIDADKHGHRAEGGHSNCSNKGVEADVMQFG